MIEVIATCTRPLAAAEGRSRGGVAEGNHVWSPDLDRPGRTWRQSQWKEPAAWGWSNPGGSQG
jgi:hypothetical protein